MKKQKEVYEDIENLIKAMITEYENQKCYYECEEYRKQGAISALEETLERVYLKKRSLNNG